MSKAKLILYWLPAIIWAVVIFSFSSTPSLRISPTDQLDFVLRKTAHMVEYFILSFLVFRALHKGSGMSKKNAAIVTFIFTIIYASSDEFHQTFVFGREGKIRDVLIDTIGNFVSVLLIWLGSLDNYI